jgi:hypothetical protein
VKRTKPEHLQAVYDAASDLSRETFARALELAEERDVDPSTLLNGVASMIMAAGHAGWDWDRREEEEREEK